MLLQIRSQHTLLTPSVRSKVPFLRQLRVPCKLSILIVPVHTLTQHCVTPPRHTLLMILNREEDDDSTERHRARQRRRKHIVVLLPPRRLVALEVVHEEHTEV